jgi:hypothetical protein
MTEQEKYLFDLQGYLVVMDALTAEQIAALDTTLVEQVVQSGQQDAPSQRFGGLLKWSAAYRDLIDNPRITFYLEELLGPRFRLDHDYADIIRGRKGPIGTTLHGGATPFDPIQFYHYQDGTLRNGLLVVAYNLKDVNPGDGGFAAVPGSHKANRPFPDEWRELEAPHPCVQPVTGPAGTAIIFTEAMTHGTLPWRSSEERHTLFYKYSPNGVSWAARYYNPDDYEGLTDRQRAILEPPNARYQGREKLRYGG